MLNLSPYINSRIASLRRTDEGERLKHQRKSHTLYHGIHP